MFLTCCGGMFIFSLCKAIFAEQMFCKCNRGWFFEYEKRRWVRNSALTNFYGKKKKRNNTACTASQKGKRKKLMKQKNFIAPKNGAERKTLWILLTAIPTELKTNITPTTHSMFTERTPQVQAETSAFTTILPLTKCRDGFSKHAATVSSFAAL